MQSSPEKVTEAESKAAVLAAKLQAYKVEAQALNMMDTTLLIKQVQLVSGALAFGLRSLRPVPCLRREATHAPNAETACHVPLPRRLSCPSLPASPSSARPWGALSSGWALRLSPSSTRMERFWAPSCSALISRWRWCARSPTTSQ